MLHPLTLAMVSLLTPLRIELIQIGPLLKMLESIYKGCYTSDKKDYEGKLVVIGSLYLGCGHLV